MSTISFGNDDSQNLTVGACGCIPQPSQKPLSPQTSTISRQDITIINCVGKKNWPDVCMAIGGITLEGKRNSSRLT
jgi:hypothetical protein